MSDLHPCLRCGACCASFRVSFYRGEALPGPGAVPDDRVEPISPFLVAMRGTHRSRPRCEALVGEIGEEVRCDIYALRPSPCHEVRPSWQDGAADPRCDAARARHGLPLLTPADWEPTVPRTPRRAA